MKKRFFEVDEVVFFVFVLVVLLFWVGVCSKHLLQAEQVSGCDGVVCVSGK